MSRSRVRMAVLGGGWIVWWARAGEVGHLYRREREGVSWRGGGRVCRASLLVRLGVRGWRWLVQGVVE